MASFHLEKHLGPFQCRRPQVCLCILTQLASGEGAGYQELVNVLFTSVYFMLFSPSKQWSPTEILWKKVNVQPVNRQGAHYAWKMTRKRSQESLTTNAKEGEF